MLQKVILIKFIMSDLNSIYLEFSSFFLSGCFCSTVSTDLIFSSLANNSVASSPIESLRLIILLGDIFFKLRSISLTISVKKYSW